MLEKIVADHPSDLTAKEHWAFSMVGSAATLPDPAERKKMRARARILAVELKEAENNQDYTAYRDTHRGLTPSLPR